MYHQTHTCKINKTRFFINSVHCHFIEVVQRFEFPWKFLQRDIGVDLMMTFHNCMWVKLTTLSSISLNTNHGQICFSKWDLPPREVCGRVEWRHLHSSRSRKCWRTENNACVAVITRLLLYFYTDLCLLCSNVSGFNLSFLNCKILVQTLANFKQFGSWLVSAPPPCPKKKIPGLPLTLQP